MRVNYFEREVMDLCSGLKSLGHIVSLERLERPRVVNSLVDKLSSRYYALTNATGDSYFMEPLATL